jgi:hypothetical protein
MASAYCTQIGAAKPQTNHRTLSHSSIQYRRQVRRASRAHLRHCVAWRPSGGGAKELGDLQPDLVEVTTTPATVAVLQQTTTVPMVFGIVLDALNSGFVEIRSAQCNGAFDPRVVFAAQPPASRNSPWMPPAGLVRSQYWSCTGAITFFY